jgi:hypothetical protein
MIAVAGDAHAEQISLSEPGGHVTTSSIVVDATPAEIYAFVTDYANWRSVFSDIESANVKSGGRENGVVEFQSRSLDNKVTVQFDNTRDRVIAFRGIKGPPGGRAHGSYTLTPLPGGRTRVDAELYLDVVGVPGVFVGESKLRPMRQAKLRSDIGDVARRFPPKSRGAS